MTENTALNMALRQDPLLESLLRSIGLQFDPAQLSPVRIKLTPLMCKNSDRLDSLEVNSQLRLAKQRELSIARLVPKVQKSLADLITLHSLEQSLLQYRHLQSTAPLVFSISYEQLSDGVLLQEMIALLLCHRFSFRNLCLELQLHEQMPRNVLALQRGVKLISSCGIQLGIFGFHAPVRLLCELIHFDYIKISGGMLNRCHMGSCTDLQQKIVNLHRMSVELGFRLICKGLPGEAELDWLVKQHFFSTKGEMVYSPQRLPQTVFATEPCYEASSQRFRPADFAL